MPLSPNQFPFRVRHAGTDPVHAAREIRDGYRAVCLLWLDPEHPHTWCAEDTEVTCTACIKRMSPEV